MILALIHGRLFKAPEENVSAGGKRYVVATVVLEDAGEGQPRFSRITAFGEPAERLVALPKGAGVAATGKLEIGLWTRDSGDTEVQVRVLVDELVALTSGGSHVRRSNVRQCRRPRANDRDREASL